MNDPSAFRSPSLFPARAARGLPRLLQVLVALVGVGCGVHRSSLPPPDWTQPAAGEGISGPPKVILEQLAAQVDASTRAAALEVLVRSVAEPGGGTYAVAATWDPEPWVQRAGVRALQARLDEPQTHAVLGALAARSEVDPYVRCRAALLVSQPVPAAVSTATDAGWTHGPVWKRVPCAAAAASWGSARAQTLLLDALAEGTLALDPDFADALVGLQLDGLDDALVAAFETADELVRPALSSVLLARGVPEGVAALRADLSHADPLVRMESVELLAAVERPETTQLLQRAAGRTDTPEGQVAALVVAARSGGSFRVFEDAFAGDNRDVRRASVTYAGLSVARAEASGAARGQRKKLERLLAAALVEPDPQTRIAALQVVGRLELAGLGSVVDALLTDDEADVAVRVAAAEARIALDAAVAVGGPGG